jgi:hypothetical protein
MVKEMARLREKLIIERVCRGVDNPDNEEEVKKAYQKEIRMLLNNQEDEPASNQAEEKRGASAIKEET